MIGKNFVTAGRAVFTIEIEPGFASRNSLPPHYTFRVGHKEANGNYPESWFVSLLTGPENTSDYTYLGMLEVRKGERILEDRASGQITPAEAVGYLGDYLVRLTAKSAYTDESWPVKVIRKVLARIWAEDFTALEASGWKVHHEGKCCRCGRALTVPESIESGIGPECAKKVG